MYRLTFEDYKRRVVDYGCETYWAAWNEYIDMLRCCMACGVAGELSLIDENTAEILACTTFSGHTDDEPDFETVC